jgi:hypothetical protein
VPVRAGKDIKGSFFRWGVTGKKYYFNKSGLSKIRAHILATRQGRAIMMNRR